MTEKNSFHLVDPSPWPLVLSTSLLLMASGGVSYIHGYGNGGLVLVLGVVMLIASLGCWLRDIIREGTYEGQHTSLVQGGFRLGFILFIVSEVMFFFGFFFGYFWLSLSGGVEGGGVYPAKGVVTVNGWEIPFLNTLILLTSGGAITWAHHGILGGDRVEGVRGLIVTIVLGLIFTGLQGYEYMTSILSISDGVFGSSFYMLTGFHGMHVLVGTIMIGVSLWRVWTYEQTEQHHFNLELAAVYWHFVDVVWLFLFVGVYIWGC